MKQSTKAMLLSALLFPGAGHAYLKHWLQAALLSGAAAWALYVIFSVVLSTALDITGQIESGAIAPDAAVISALVTERLEATEGTTNVATVVLAVSWLAGILGSYWQGRNTEHDTVG
ncbi:MAG: hypothetical protein KDI17_05440 [Halioglobus sp.]|nr:hypothetical protein [Halioglobus sp.]